MLQVFAPVYLFCILLTCGLWLCGPQYLEPIPALLFADPNTELMADQIPRQTPKVNVLKHEPEQIMLSIIPMNF